MTVPLTQTDLRDQLFPHRFQDTSKVALAFLSGGSSTPVRYTYSELGERIVEVSGQLQARVPGGERVLLAFPPGPDFAAAFLGCLHAGVVAVPVCPPRNRSDSQRFCSVVEDARPEVIFTTESLAERLRTLPGGEGQRFLPIDCAPSAEASRWQRRAIGAEQLAVIQYTSGSTSRPLGVAITWANLLQNLRNMQERLRLAEGTTIVSWLPFFHDLGLMGGLMLPIHAGASGHFLSASSFLRRPSVWLTAISELGAEVSGGPNFAYDHCLRRIPENERRRFDLSSWRIAISGGEPVRAETLSRFARGFAISGFRASSFAPCYGLAEATLMVSGGPFGSAPSTLSLDRAALEAGTVVEASAEESTTRTLVGNGRPPSDVELRIVNPGNRQPCTDDRIGEIWVSGPMIAEGYWNRPDESEQTFGATLNGDPGRRYLRTGDLGFLRRGELFVAGRLKDLIIVRGSNHHPEDLEETLSSCHTLLGGGSASAFGVDGVEGEQLVLVAEVSRAVQPEQCEEIVDKITTSITEAHGVRPDVVLLVRQHSLPRTSSYKIRRSETRQRWSDGHLKVVAEWREGVTKGPSTIDGDGLPACREDIERWLIDELAQRRHLDRGLVDTQASLSRFGIDSLEAMEFLAEVESRFGRSVDVESIDGPLSIRAVATLLASDPVLSTAQPRRHEGVGTGQLPADGEHESHGTPQVWSDRFSLLSERYEAAKASGDYIYQRPISKNLGSWVEVAGKRKLMLASYGYLGLLGHPRVAAATQRAIERLGTGSHGVPLLAGSTTLHRELERKLSSFAGSEDAVVFSSGYVTNITTLSTILDSDSVVICDQLNHASIIDGCNLSGASMLMFEHNCLPDLERTLELAGDRPKLVVVDAVYSMDGDVAPLPEISKLCHEHSALLMVDEAHSLGVLGKTGKGIEEHFGLPPRTIDIKMGTLSKTIPSTGGYVCSSKSLIAALKHNSRAFIFSAALAPPQAAAALEALNVIEDEPQRVAELSRRATQFCDGVKALGFDTLRSETAIVPLVCRDEESTLKMAGWCEELGVFAVPVIYPAVPLESPRIRATVTAAHCDDDIALALSVLERAGRESGVIG